MLGTSRAGQIDRSQAEDIVNAYLEAGGNFIDTSDAYLGGESEENARAVLARTSYQESEGMLGTFWVARTS